MNDMWLNFEADQLDSQADAWEEMQAEFKKMAEEKEWWEGLDRDNP